ncbi:hypothetical protein B0G84_8554 [Paraburkholderia sp. BL8N3]|nr:hypothetical protein [Paraburkholderia sp. BL8N3]TCK32702.1 hypothetical protein B0G84_8554 [Paraburkholderia sp. BL8N3]
MLVAKHVRMVDPSTFASYLELVSRHLGMESPDNLPDGIGDLEGSSGPVSYAVRRNIAFAAFRWLHLRRPACQVETFFVSPASKPAHSAVQMRSLQCTPEEHENPFLAAWWGQVPGQAGEATTLPGFLELAAMLASDGQAASANGELLTRVRALESELAYARIAATDLARELATARENLKLMSIGSYAMGLDSLLKHKPGAASGAAGSQAATSDGLADLQDWAQQNAERIVILPRAFAGAKKSQYESPATIMAALEFLADTYRRHKLGNLSLMEFDERLKAQPFQISSSVGASVAGAQGDQYFVNWGGRRMMLDHHVVKGANREPRYCMRIYFFWDTGSGRCVVGSLPQHLENSLT